MAFESRVDGTRDLEIPLSLFHFSLSAPMFIHKDGPWQVSSLAAFG